MTIYYSLWDSDDCEYDLFSAESIEEAKEIAQDKTNRNGARLELRFGRGNGQDFIELFEPLMSKEEYFAAAVLIDKE
jgi:hypothetical protein